MNNIFTTNTKFITAFLVIALLVTSCNHNDEPVPENVKADPVDCNIANESLKKDYEKFLCIGSDLPRSVHIDDEKDVFAESYCPDISNVKYGHTYLLVDTTQALTTNQMEAVYKRFLSPDKIKNLAPYDKLSVMNIAGFNEEKGIIEDVIMNDPYFSECKPRSGQTGTMFAINEYVSKDDALGRMQLKHDDWLSKLTETQEEIVKHGARESDFSQIMEQLYELSRRDDFQANWKYRKILIFSDLLQHSDNVSIWNSCVKTARKKCKTFKTVKESMKDEKWSSFVPDFGPNPPSVHVMYMNCFADKELKTGALTLWQEYFADLGISMTFELETSFGCQVDTIVGNNDDLETS
tara:strand:+ start:1627 stop:2679 length:1053 start_codon:yes stop_codon:yes gene_type:complete